MYFSYVRKNNTYSMYIQAYKHFLFCSNHILITNDLVAENDFAQRGIVRIGQWQK